MDNYNLLRTVIAQHLRIEGKKFSKNSIAHIVFIFNSKPEVGEMFLALIFKTHDKKIGYLV
jgi:hypothetical protein